MTGLAAALDRIRTLEAKIGMGHNGGPSFEGDTRELIPDAEAAFRLGISVRTLERWDHDSKLAFPKPVRVNGRRFRRPVELARWVAKRAKAAQRGPNPKRQALTQAMPRDDAGRLAKSAKPRTVRHKRGEVL